MEAVLVPWFGRELETTKTLLGGLLSSVKMNLQQTLVNTILLACSILPEQGPGGPR